MSTTRWHKAYQGPFKKTEAQQIAGELRAKAKPDINGIYDARVRARRSLKLMKRCVCTAACGAGLGHNERYDVWIKTFKEPKQ